MISFTQTKEEKDMKIDSLKSELFTLKLQVEEL